jgi:hypothetical protein
MRPRLALAVTLAISACASADDSAATFTTRDSADVVIIESTAPLRGADDARLHMAKEPALDVGVAEGDPAYELTGVVGALRLAGGQMVVASATVGELRFYDAGGRHIRTVGRLGEGPGEFRNLGGIFRLGADSLVAWDRALRRATVLDTAGAPARSLTLDSPDGELSPALAGVFDDGTLLVYATGSITAEVAEGLQRLEGVVARHDAAGKPIEVFGPLAAAEWVEIATDAGPALTTRAFQRNGYVATDGRIAYYGDSDRWEIAGRDAGGDRLRLLRRTSPPVAVTPGIIADYVEERLDGVEDAATRRAVTSLFDGMPFPETLPAFGRLIASTDGRLWVEMPGLPGDSASTFSVIDTNGVWLDDVAVPSALHIFDVGSDYVLGRWLDAFDVQHVRLYALDER